MKQFIPTPILTFLILFFFASFGSKAQTSTENYIQILVPKTPQTNADNVSGGNPSQSNEVIKYFDGFGRPIQEVKVKVSPSQNDVINYLEYDQYGKPKLVYLPYKAAGVSGSYRTNAKNELLSFYSNSSETPNTSKPFSETVFRNAPIEEKIEQGFSGEQWQIGTGKTIKYARRLNKTNDHILKWKTNVTNNLPEVENANPYTIGQLISSFNFATTPPATDVSNIAGLVGRLINPETAIPYITNKCFTSDISGNCLSFYKNGFDNTLQINKTITFSSSYVRLSFYAVKPNLSSGATIKVTNLITGNILLSGYSPKTIWESVILDFYSPTNLISLKIEVENGSWNGDDIVLIDELNLNKLNPTTFVAKEYSSGELELIEEKNEDNLTVQKFYDGLGNIICERKVLSSTENLDNYYVYNEYNLLASIVPPQAISLLPASNYDLFNPTTQLFEKFVFHYSYDEKKRVAIKKLPGGGLNQIVYDLVDRPFMVQDKNQMNHSTTEKDWTFVKYDKLGRLAYSGIYHAEASLNRATIQNNINSSSNYYEEDLGSNFPYYTFNAIPSEKPKCTIQSAYYYDEYDYTNDGIIDYSLGASSLWPYLGNISYLQNPIGLVTVEKHLIINSSPTTYLDRIHFYDEYKREIVSAQKTIEGGWLIDVLVYDFAGNILSKKTFLDRNGSGSNLLTYFEEYTYDAAGRMIQFWITPPNQSRMLAANYKYNALGNLIQKQIHSFSVNNNYLQTVDYSYNIRGWLKKVNDADNLNNDLFAVNYFYEENKTLSGLSNTPKFDGNITGTKWVSDRDKVNRGYFYSYDQGNRLQGANYFGYTTGTSPIIENGRYDVGNLAYDKNGNILSLDQNGLLIPRPNFKIDAVSSSFGPMDGLSYQYDGNVLKNVSDNSPVPLTGLNDFPDRNKNSLTGLNDYEYDQNNNLTKDRNKSIASIRYNQLNLPDEITWDNGDKLENVYDATGKKLQMTMKANSIMAVGLYYLGPFLFEYNPSSNNYEFESYSHKEGRIVPQKTFNAITNTYVKTGELLYYYDYKDHQGNTRMVFTPKLDANNHWLSTYEDFDLSGDDISPGKVSDPTYDPQRARFQNWGELRTVEEHYEGLYSAKVTDNQGTILEMDAMVGDSLEAEVYAKSELGTDPDPGPNNWLLALVGLNPSMYALNAENQYVYTGPTVTFNFVPLLIGIANLLNTPDPTNTISGALIVRSLDSNNDVIDAYAIPARSVSWTKLGLHYTVTDPNVKKVQLFISAKNGRNVYYDNFSVNLKRMQAKIVQENHYYPYGLNIKGLEYLDDLDTNFSNLYSGKESVLRNQLEWNDHGARYYDPQIARWNVVDPNVNLRVEWTPYNAMRCNPILNIDPEGALDTDFKDKSGNLVSHIDDGSNAVFQQTGKGDNLHYQFSGYNDQGGKNVVDEKTVTSVIQEQQKLNISNPDLQPGAGGASSHCNQATQCLQKAIGSAIGKDILTPGRANDIAISLPTNTTYKSVNLADATKAANSGGFVIVAYKNPDPKKSGHLATLSVGENIKKGMLANVGYSKGVTNFVNPIGTEKNGWKDAAFKKEDWNKNVKFYIPTIPLKR